MYAQRNVTKRQRPCDVCRRRKIKCDGQHKVDNVCSNCLMNRIDCTHNDPVPQRHHAPSQAYVQDLERKLNNMSTLLEKLCPEGTFPSAPDSRDEPASTSARRPLTRPVTSSLSSHDFRAPLHDFDDDSSDDEVPDFFRFTQNAHLDPASTRYFGKSAHMKIVRRAVETKVELIGRPLGVDRRRPEYWCIPWWERQGIPHPMRPARAYEFPEPNLLRALADAYFTEVNVFWPLLHRPMFDRSMIAGKHLEDDDFANIVLLVCAAGSRFVDDVRVLEDSSMPLSAGWKYYNQVHEGFSSPLVTPTLSNIQIMCLQLSVTFLQATATYQNCWSIIGVAIRLAQDVGVHRRKVYASMPTILQEQWRRAFWVLIAFDRAWSAAMGRPCAIQDEDFDLDWPTECDDEYWEPSGVTLAFQQSADRPSYTSFFIWLLKLQEIVSFALRTLYSTTKSKVLHGFIGPEWEQKLVTKLNSALDTWLTSLPHHVRWDAKCGDDVFFHQAATLRCTYHMVQVMVNRPHAGDTSPLTRSSMATCVDAARACSRVLDAHQRRRQKPLPSQIAAVSMTTVVLLHKLWDEKRHGAGAAPAVEMEEVLVGMRVLKRLEPKWLIAGRIWESLWQLASGSDMPSSVPAAATQSDREPPDWPALEDIGLDSAPPRWPSTSLDVVGLSAEPWTDGPPIPDSSYLNTPPEVPGPVATGLSMNMGASFPSTDELAAWLDAPLGNLEGWDSWLNGISTTDVSGQ